ncbi:MAG: 4-alpha-glucanotransferase, partial [Rhodanobacteraceae bacterium]
PTPDVGSDADAFVDDAVTFVGACASRLALVPLEDVVGLIDQVNIPGTIDAHPNWQRRMPDETARLFKTPAVTRRLHALREARARS